MSEPTIALIRLTRQDAKDVDLWLKSQTHRPAEASEFRSKLSDEIHHGSAFAFVHLKDADATAVYEWLEGRQAIPDALVRLRTSLADRLGIVEDRTT